MFLLKTKEQQLTDCIPELFQKFRKHKGDKLDLFKSLSWCRTNSTQDVFDWTCFDSRN